LHQPMISATRLRTRCAAPARYAADFIRRHARPAGLAVGRVEVARQARQHPVRPLLDLTQRVIRRDQIVNGERVKNSP
jgi:hypothetical protein